MEKWNTALESVVTPAFWKEKRIFITGHTGFKGAWLTVLLRHLGAEVTGYALDPPTQPSLFEAAHLQDDMIDLRGDVRDAALLQDVMCRADADIVIHFAAQSLVRVSYKDPLGTYATNVMGTAHFLQAVQAAKPKVALIATTDKVYRHQPDNRAFREDDALGGQADPYSSSKACAEIIVAQFIATLSQSCALVSARAGNVIGGGDFAEDRLLPDAVRAFSSGTTLALRYPQAIRPWQHVLEPLIGYLTLCEKAYARQAEFSGAWNFGPGASHEWSVLQMVSAFAQHWPRASFEEHVAWHPQETDVLRLNSQKARAYLGWSCRLSCEEALAWSADFYHAMHLQKNLRALMHSQIEDYLKRCAFS